MALGDPIGLRRFGMAYKRSEGSTVKMAGWVPPAIFGGAGATLGAWLFRGNNSFVGGLLGFVVGALGGIFVRGRWDANQQADAPAPAQPNQAHTNAGPPAGSGAAAPFGVSLTAEEIVLRKSVMKLAEEVGMDAKTTQDELAKVASLPVLSQYTICVDLHRLARNRKIDQHRSVLALMDSLVKKTELGGERRLYLAQRLGVNHKAAADAVLVELESSNQPRIAHLVRSLRHPIPKADQTVPSTGVGSSEGLEDGEQIVFVARDGRYHFNNPAGASVVSMMPRYEVPLVPSAEDKETHRIKPRLTVFRTEQGTICCVASSMNDGHPSSDQRGLQQPGITISIESATAELSAEQKQLVRLFLLPPETRQTYLKPLSVPNHERPRPRPDIVDGVQKVLLAPNMQFSLGEADEIAYANLVEHVVKHPKLGPLYCADDKSKIDFPLKFVPI